MTVEAPVRKLPVEQRAEQHRRNVEQVAKLWRMGWRTTAISLHMRQSAATISKWLQQAQSLGLVPARPPGRPRLKRL